MFAFQNQQKLRIADSLNNQTSKRSQQNTYGRATAAAEISSNWFAVSTAAAKISSFFMKS